MKMPASGVLRKHVFPTLAIILLSFHIAAAQPATPSPAASPPSVPGAGKPAGGKATPSEVSVPPEKSQPIIITRFEKAPVIDGKLDDEAWKTTVPLKDFYQIHPGDNIAPSQPTEAFIGYDSKFLYFGFHAYDEPGKVRATVAGRDDVFDEDNIRVFLDTFNDQRKAYVLGFNPLGVQQDGILTEGGGEDYSVDIVMESKGELTSDGWTLEVAIPFKSLRYEAGKGKLWGFHVWRNIARLNDEIDSWVPISRDKSGTMTQAAHLTGLVGISTERTLELIPSVTFSETGRRVNAIPASALALNPTLLDPGRTLNQPIKVEPGLTVKYGITPTVTLDLALNPDFAQVEADQTVITANQRFPIFFEEKRPFFLEGIDIFRTDLQPVHTRAIVDPDIAMKVSGKLGRNTFGLMLASDNAPGNFTEDDRNDPDALPVIERFLDKNAYIGVLRLKRDVGKDSSLGFIATTYNFIEKHNHLAGFDGRLRLGPQTYFSFQLLGTTSRRCFFEPRTPEHAPTIAEPCFAGSDDLGPSSTRNHYRTGNGLAYSYNYDKEGRHFGYNFNGQGRTRDYQADVGFTRRRNTNFHDFFVRYNSEPKPKAKLISWRIFNSIRGNYDWQGHLQNWEDEAQIQLSLQRSSHFGVGFVGGYERLFEEEFGPARTTFQDGTFFGPNPERSTYQASPYLFAGTRPNKKFGANLFLLHTSGAFDLDFGAGPKFPRVSPPALATANARATGQCDGNNPPPVCATPLLDPGTGSQWNMEIEFSYQPTNALSFELEYNKQRLWRKDTRLVAFDDNVYSAKSTYQFSRFVFARARVDYDTLESSVRGQFLLGYTPNPGTAFYAGYNDDLVRNGFSPFTGQLEPGLRRNGRTFFIKLSYLIRRSFGS